MRLFQKTTLACLLLSFALLGGSARTSFSQENNQAKLQTQEKDKQELVNKLKDDWEKQEDKVNKERTECDRMREETKKSGKNPDDVRVAPNTVKQCGEILTAAQTQARETQERLDAARNELEVMRSQISPLPPEMPIVTRTEWLPVLLIVVGGVLCLLMLLGGLYRVLSKKIGHEREFNEASLRAIRKKNAESDKQLGGLSAALRLQQNKIEALQLKLREKDNDFKEIIDELLRAVKLQQEKIEALEFKTNKSNERTI